MKKIHILIVLLVLLISCHSADFKRTDIDRIELYLVEKDNNLNMVRKLLPGKQYQVVLKVYENGKSAHNLNYQDFCIESPDKSISVIHQDSSSIIIKPVENLFKAIEFGSFYFILKVLENPYLKEFHFDLDLSNDSIDYTGIDGNPGESGSHGSDSTFLAFNYNISPDPEKRIPMLLLADIVSYKLYSSNSSTIEIDGSGGDGGKGIDGPDYSRGGNGGNGGGIRILYSNPSIIRRIRLKSHGGIGGEPGHFKTIGETGFLTDNKHGEYGHRGLSGQTEFYQISEDEVIRILSRILGEYFSQEKILN